MKASQQKYLESIEKRINQIETQIVSRKLEQQKVNKIFIQHVQKQLQMLQSQQLDVKERNQTFIQEIKDFRNGFNKFAPQVMQIDQKIRQAKQRLLIEYMNQQADMNSYEAQRRSRY